MCTNKVTGSSNTLHRMIRYPRRKRDGIASAQQQICVPVMQNPTVTCEMFSAGILVGALGGYSNALPSSMSIFMAGFAHVYFTRDLVKN